MKLVFSEEAWEDYQYWLGHDPQKQKRINELIKATCRDPYEGIGKPEPLKHILQGCWSRRIDQEHRFVYKVEGEKLLILQLRYHY